MSQEEHITFERLPGIISDIRKDIKELKVLVIQGQNDSSTGDEWMDVNGLCAYHPDHPAKKTVYDWVTLKRVPYHKDGKRLRFKRSEIDAWLAGQPMSKSKLRSKYMRSLYKGHSLFTSKMNDSVRNPHRQDEMPKNRPSKLVTMHCGVKSVDWLQDSTSFGGHSRPKGGHRRVSGLVRASLRRETRKLILEQLEDDEQR